MQAALDSKVDDSQVGAANGVASLGADGKVPASQLPTPTTPAAALSKQSTALLPYRLAQGNRKYGRTTIVVHGDSTEEGVGTTSNDRTRTWPSRMATTIRSSYTGGGEGADPGHPNFLPACGPGAMHSSGTTSWRPTGAPPAEWTIDESRGPSGYALKADAAGSVLTLSLPANVGVTTYALVYRRGPDASYSFTSTLNGGATTANPANGALRDGTWTSIQNVTASVANTVVITAGGANTIIEGVVLLVTTTLVVPSYSMSLRVVRWRKTFCLPQKAARTGLLTVNHRPQRPVSKRSST